MRTSVTGVSNNVLLKAGLDRIQSGDILTLKIIENSKGLTKVLLKGKTIYINSMKDLIPGKTIKVRAQWSGKTLYLHRLELLKIDNPFTEAGLKNNPASMLLLEAARRAGLSIRENNIKILKKLLRTDRKLNKETARFAAEAVKKGLSPDNLIALITANYDFSDGKDEEKTKLFNQLSSDNELWFIVPYKLRIEEYELKGSLRIKKNLLTKQIETVVIESIIEEEKIYFLIRNYNKVNTELKILTEGKLKPKIRKKIKENLNEIQGNLSLKIDDNIIEECFVTEKGLNFDGFSLIYNNYSGFEAIV